MLGYALLAGCCAAAASLLTWSAADPSFLRAAGGATRNALGAVGANFSDLAMRLFGLAAVFIILPPVFWALQLITRRQLEDARMKLMLAPVAVLLLACAISTLPGIGRWPLPYGLGGLLGDQTLRFLASLLVSAGPQHATAAAGGLCLVGGLSLLIGSLGMSLQDLRLICRGGWHRLQLIARGWRWRVRFDRLGETLDVRREPTLDMPSPTLAAGRRPPLSAEPAFDFEPRLGPAGEPPPGVSGKRVNLRRPVRDPEFDKTTETGCHDMARRFAPARDEPSGAIGFGLRRRGVPPQSDRPGAGGRPAQRKPVWPGSVPAPAAADPPAAEWPPHGRTVGDDLYGRAVAIVRAQRKASTEYLQQSLGIGYMRAADLIDRMEREGIVGARVHNGMRPILGAPPRIV